jgi:hypothetical protein
LRGDDTLLRPPFATIAATIGFGLSETVVGFELSRPLPVIFCGRAGTERAQRKKKSLNSRVTH